MKRKAFSLLSIFLLLACTAGPFGDQLDGMAPEASGPATFIPIETAWSTVQDALDAMTIQTKGAEMRSISEGYLMDKSRLTKTASGAPGDTIPPFYVFNFDNNQGYALASVDSRMSPILCIIDSGHFSPDSVLTNPGQIVLLSRIETLYRMALELPIENARGEILTADQYAAVHIPLVLTEGEGSPQPEEPDDPPGWPRYYYYGPLLSTKWHQHDPFDALMYNGSNQRCPVGCANIAIAQILKYHGNPISLDGYYVDWGGIATNIVDSTSVGCSTLQNYLIRAAWAMDADMQPDKTGIDPNRIPSFLHSIGYHANGLQNLNFNQLDAEMHANRPVFGSGYVTENISWFFGIPYYSDGHGWVYDGMLRYVHIYQTSQYGVGTEVLYLPHCALGWQNGDANGYYYLGDVNTGSCPFLDNFSNQSYWIQYDMKMITGIYY